MSAQSQKISENSKCSAYFLLFQREKDRKGGKGKVRRGERKECRQEKGRDSSKYLKYFKQLELVTLTSSLTKSPTNTL